MSNDQNSKTSASHPQVLDIQISGFFFVSNFVLRISDFPSWSPASPNDISRLVELYDSIAYLTRLLAQIAEKKFQLDVA